MSTQSATLALNPNNASEEHCPELAQLTKVIPNSIPETTKNISRTRARSLFTSTKYWRFQDDATLQNLSPDGQILTLYSSPLSRRADEDSFNGPVTS
jgi:hypothetical protein